MRSQDARADLAVLPKLCGIVVLLFVAGYLGSEYIVLRNLRVQAEEIVGKVYGQVAPRIRADFAFADAAGPAGSPRYLDLQHDEAGSLASVQVIDPEGRLAAPAADGKPADPAFLSQADRAAFDRMQQTGTAQYIKPDPTEQARTIFYVPLKGGDGSIGGLRVDLDQSGNLQMLRSSMQSAGALAIALIFIALLVTIFTIWQYIKDRQSAHEEIDFLARHDMLTALPNRAQFITRLKQALSRLRNDDKLLAVLYIDVDNFKDVNDALGHPIGDRILKETGARIRAASGPRSTISRLSGDEFAVMIEGISDETALKSVAERYLRQAAAPHDIDGQEVICSVSIGISMAPADGTDAEILMKNADLALFQAKADGRNKMRFFTVDLDEGLRRRRKLEAELRQDLSADRLTVHYQPQFDLRTGSLIGYEALSRWWNPELGDVSPTIFIPIAEACGLMAELSERVLMKACEAATHWPDDVKLAVNLSATQFKANEVADAIEKVLQVTKLPPGRLEVEITETVLLQNTNAALASLNRLRQLGVSIALDDFGTGYSSLSYLSRFPIDKIKIDRSFVQRLNEDQGTAAIVKAIVGLGDTLQLDIMAEGVETHQQAALLRTIGCHHVQGFLYGVPKAVVEFPVPEVIRMQETLARMAN